MKKIHEIYTTCFPLKTKFISEKRYHNPWISQAVINSIKQKNKLCKDFKIGAVSEFTYKEYRNTLNRLISRAKQSYYMKIFTNFKNNTRTIWNAINQLTNNYKKSSVHSIDHNNELLTTPQKIAEAFNDYYVNIAPNLDHKIPPSTANPLEFLRGDYPTSMLIPIVYPQEVINVILSLKNKKSNPMEIPVSLIKANKDQIAVPICSIYLTNLSLPEDFLNALNMLQLFQFTKKALNLILVTIGQFHY